MFAYINDGISRCCEVKLIEKSKKMIKFGKILRFFKKKFADSLRLGRLALYMAKPNKNNAFKGLTLGYEVLQKCSNFFQYEFGFDFEPEIGLEEGSIPTYQ